MGVAVLGGFFSCGKNVTWPTGLQRTVSIRYSTLPSNTNFSGFISLGVTNEDDLSLVWKDSEIAFPPESS